MDTQNPAQSVKDTRLISRAMRERWKVPPEAKRAIVEACQELVERREARSMLFAAKILLEADKVDQADEHLAEKHRRLDEGKATERVEAPIKFIKGVEPGDL